MSTASQRDVLTTAAEKYLGHVGEAAEYLEGRGLLDEDLLTHFRLGVVAEPLPGHEPFRGRLSIPYITPSGVVNMRFRSLDGSDPKYLSLPGGATNLYNVMALHRPGDMVLVCEGELDAVAASHAGFLAVGVPGANAWQPHFARLLQDFERVVVVADGDEAGKGLSTVVRKAVEGAEVRLMPDGHDVNSFLLERGADAFDEWVA